MQQSTYQSHSATMNCYNNVPYGGTYHVDFATAVQEWMGTKKVPIHLPRASLTRITNDFFTRAKKDQISSRICSRSTGKILRSHSAG